MCPPKRARASGIFDQDISSEVAAILLGRELEPSVVQQTNLINPDKTRYDGTYISVDHATATEVWFAEMLDYLVTYETSTYNWQHPSGDRQLAASRSVVSPDGSVDLRGI